jgi:hypothetical protein
VEVAYRGGNLFDTRRQLDDAWAGRCASPAASGKAVAIGL